MAVIQNKTVILTRYASSDEGTFGILTLGSFKCFSAELPWRNNQRKISCIEEGDYPVKVVASPRFGKVYGLFRTKGRSHVLIHRGNFAGDIFKDFDSNVEGCIVLGSRVGKIRNSKGKMQQAVLLSQPTVREFQEQMAFLPFTLRVTSSYKKGDANV